MELVCWGRGGEGADDVRRRQVRCRLLLLLRLQMTMSLSRPTHGAGSSPAAVSRPRPGRCEGPQLTLGRCQLRRSRRSLGPVAGRASGCDVVRSSIPVVVSDVTRAARYSSIVARLSSSPSRHTNAVASPHAVLLSSTCTNSAACRRHARYSPPSSRRSIDVRRVDTPQGTTVFRLTVEKFFKRNDFLSPTSTCFAPTLMAVHHFIRVSSNPNQPGRSGYGGLVKQGGSPDEARLEQTPYPFQPH